MVLWTPEHTQTLIPAVIVFLILGVILKLTIGKKSFAVLMIPFQILACLLFIIEIGKQVYSLTHGYDLYHLPFHFCSLFIFMLPIMAFYRGKHQQTVFTITTSICAAMTLLLLIYPALIYSDGNIKEFFTHYLSFHTVAFHNIVVLEFILILALRLYNPGNTKEVKAPLLFTCGFCAVSATMAQLLKTNYANFYSCNIPPLEAIRLSLQPILGYAVTQIIYVLINASLNILFVLLSFWFVRLVYRIMAGKKLPV